MAYANQNKHYKNIYKRIKHGQKPPDFIGKYGQDRFYLSSIF